MEQLQSSACLSVAIVSDTHSYLHPEIIKLVKKCDYVVHAGDIGCNQILKLLKPKRSRVIAVKGNNDHINTWDKSEHEVVNTLQQVARLDLPGGLLVVEHGEAHGFHTPCHDKLRKAHPYARAIVYGHTHKQVIDQSSDPWVLNPGAAGKTRTHGGASCLVLHASPIKDWNIECFRFSE